tara:strand:+ start:123 stop:509 length:387 start_codon:yes stop_codon:yes gene_type:complete
LEVVDQLDRFLEEKVEMVEIQFLQVLHRKVVELAEVQLDHTVVIVVETQAVLEEEQLIMLPLQLVQVVKVIHLPQTPLKVTMVEILVGILVVAVMLLEVEVVELQRLHQILHLAELVLLEVQEHQTIF